MCSAAQSIHKITTQRLEINQKNIHINYESTKNDHSHKELQNKLEETENNSEIPNKSQRDDFNKKQINNHKLGKAEWPHRADWMQTKPKDAQTN